MTDNKTDYKELAKKLSEVMHKLHKSKKQKGMNEQLQGESFIIEYIYKNREKDILPGEIAENINISSARTANVLNGLEKKGIITRQIDLNDRRRIIVKLTQSGERLANEKRHEMTKHIALMLEHIGEHDAKEYLRIMEKLSDFAARETTCDKNKN